ncbi:family 1 encapsulin nanocompartment shell protein [Catenulispora yoronensis]|uniref:Type 1 encapsulin shell protein n=1 Tax=Catenulispora yoronensis TaxID=450799 RepID=A0ABP5F7E1_9ACTN
MDNLHRDLAPVSDTAWEQIEEEARRTVLRYLAFRRVVDVAGPDGPTLGGVGDGHTTPVPAPGDGVQARLRGVNPLVEVRIPFELDRQAVDDAERGAQDSDWQPVKDAAKIAAFTEDRAIADGYAAAGVTGLRPFSSHAAMAQPEDPADYPALVARMSTQLRLAGVEGPYHLVLGADAYQALSDAVDHGYPVAAHVARLIDGDVIWAPAITGGVLLSGRGGDYQLQLGQDLSIGYESHTAEKVRLYFTQSFTFLPYTAEAAVPLNGQTKPEGRVAKGKRAR